jgi:hypothetical protein
VNALRISVTGNSVDLNLIEGPPQLLSQNVLKPTLGEVILHEYDHGSVDPSRNGTQGLDGEFPLLNRAVQRRPNRLMRQGVECIVTMRRENGP